MYEKVTHERKPCDQCGSMWTPMRKTSRFCSDQCRLKSHRKAVTDKRDFDRMMKAEVDMMKHMDDYWLLGIRNPNGPLK